MDRNSPTHEERQRLIRLAAAARCRLTGEVAALRHRLDIPSRIRSSLKGHPVTWLAGSLASGIAASFLFRRKPQSTKKRRSLSAILLDLTLTAARPMVKLWLGDQFKLWLARLASQAAENRLLSRTSPTSKFR